MNDYLNILITFNSSCLNQTLTLLKSLHKTNPNNKFIIYVLYDNLTSIDIDSIKTYRPYFKYKFIKVNQKDFEKFPIKSNRYPKEIYYRLFASIYLPNNIDRILYLDTDIVVINDIKKLYYKNFHNNYYLASTHIRKVIHKFNEKRLDINKDNLYVNSGVLLINLKELRKNFSKDKINEYVISHKNKLLLPDQDIISGVYKGKIGKLDSLKYNLGDRHLKLYNLKVKDKIDMDWIKENTIIVHYYGKNKPWKKHYKGILNCFYEEYN
jgi:lipopolysaccharide biosynthesis glycosyltransferase